MSGTEPSGYSPNRPALVLVTACAFVVGLLPYLLLLGKPAWSTGIAAIAAGMASLAVRGQGSHATATPTLGEWLLGAWSVVAQAATLSFLGLAIYGLFYLVIRYGGQLLGVDSVTTAVVWAQRVSAVMVVLACIVTPREAVMTLATKLYPPVPGTRSPFFALAANPRKWLWAVVLVPAVLGIALWFFNPSEAGFAVALALILFYSSFPLADFGRDSRPRAEGVLIESVVRKLFAVCGFEVLAAPAPEGPEEDALAREVDFLARGEGRLLAVAVKRHSANAAAAEWQTASLLRSAVGIMRERLSVRQGGEAGLLQPCLVVVGGLIGDSLRAFTTIEGVMLVHIPPDKLPASGDAITIEERTAFEAQLRQSRQAVTTADTRPAT